jgi:hypothetical protein
MEVTAQEIASLIDNPDYVGRERLSIDVAINKVFRSTCVNQGAVPDYDANLLKGHEG